ncbi:hypothetical protein Acr_15g0012580 [Actinidia rufa]|uniref:Uncharacterized protein n=1 Tax=Actinidia rufa TaxID=165716 RepID=A0A7J0FWW3_9ERIC|nr:hypothetical protein Acr_15g0012580 [Actinidia rufa]
MSGVGMEVAEMQPLAKVLNCQIQMLPIKYLGLPLEANSKLKATWKTVVDKIKFRLSSWKRRQLSFGGRIVLIKVVLLSLPLYYISIFKMPEGVIKTKICGGLGIRDIKLLNEALLLKWWWRFGMDKSSLWRKVLNAKYSMELAMFEAFIENAKLRVGDGSTIKFWKDIWLGNLPLQSQFPTLYRITINKFEFLSDVYIRFEETQRWDFLFRRPLLDREVEALEDLNELMAISGVEINLDRHDQLIWQGCSLEKFSIGNAWINDDTDEVGRYDYFASHALISYETLYQIKKYCNVGINATPRWSSDECMAVAKEAYEDLENIDLHNIYAPLCHNTNLTQKPKKTSVSYSPQFLQ